MKAVAVVSRAKEKADMLDSLRDLGILHLSERKPADALLTERFATLSKLSLELKDYVSKTDGSVPTLSEDEFEEMYSDTVNALKRQNELSGEKASLRMASERLKAWGNFIPAEVSELKSKGIEFRFYRIDKKELKRIREDERIKFIRLSPVDKLETAAVFEGFEFLDSLNEFVLPEKGIDELKAEIEKVEKEIFDCEQKLRRAAKYLDRYSEEMLKTQNDVEYSAVGNTLENDGGLVWITGYIPVSEEENFIRAAKEHSWAWQSVDAEEGDAGVPTKIKYNKLTALIKPVFDILGTVPGYGEYDISFWFLAFFTLFFAMIIGDAGYGLVFLIAAVALTVKTKKVTNVNLLLYLLSAATVAWGAITGTWFGAEKAMEIPFLKALVIPGFANYPEYFEGVTTAVAQNNVMKFCFSIGVVQLALACIMNVRRKIARKDLSWLSDLGWLLSICALYFMVLYLVIGQSVNVTAVAITVGIGFLMVILFGGMSPDKSFIKGLKSGLGDTFTVFLNTISAFGNVMSYIRLFAVGMASIAIAQSFNDMASGFSGPLVIVGAVIMIIGHLLNIVMGFLSVVVHGVRLNLLEFSGQLGMEWSGTAYEPFKTLKQIKK